ncbi:CGNR zinc finger domain-containing protein [Candidatus Binatus sp.]
MARVAEGRSRVRSDVRCLWLLLDESKNRTRRWCSMQS